VNKKGNSFETHTHTHMHKMAWTSGIFVAVVSMWEVPTVGSG
jgi:hypothetical protein